MATETVLNTITESLYTLAEWADPTGLIRGLNQGVFSQEYGFRSDVFPEDLGAEYMNHYMIMKFYGPQGPLTPNYGPLNRNGFTNNVYNVALFMPSEAGGGLFPIFDDTHEYAEISMSNILLNQIGAAKAFVKSGAAATGRAINPGVQVLYKSTQLRTFDFAFLFAPRSEKESQTMKSIIKTIRKYSAPEDQDYFYRSPAEVQIEFHFNGQVNPHVIQMKRQVVTGITVQYAPQGIYSTFTNGHPVSSMFTMRTKEMEIIDRADVEAGY